MRTLSEMVGGTKIRLRDVQTNFPSFDLASVSQKAEEPDHAHHPQEADNAQEGHETALAEAK